MNELEKAAERIALLYGKILENQDWDVQDLDELLDLSCKDGMEWKTNQSPWISVEDKLPDTDNGQSLYNVIIKFDDGSHYIVANIDVEDMAKAGGATHWCAIPE